MLDPHEMNFDGLVGPTHNYAGLAHGNLASQRWKGTVASPRAAALEGLAKMKLLTDLGIAQAVLPPHERPDVAALRSLGFAGSDAQVIEAAHRSDPVLLATCCSASAMWAANAATVSPGFDAADRCAHLTPANLVHSPHRHWEAATTARVLRRIFADAAHFAHHPPLPAAADLADEGAANHTRLCRAHGGPGIELFVFGRSALDTTLPAPQRFRARQTREASAAIARLHRLDPAATLLVQQNPAAVDAGVFHNDVIAVGNEHVLLCHEDAFVDTPAVLDHLRATFVQVCGGELTVIAAGRDEVPIEEAVASYLFNSQLLTLPGGGMLLLAPAECEASAAAQRYLQRVRESTAVRQVRYVDVRQSMCNGGGPACLRLRVVLSAAQRAAVLPSVVLTEQLYPRLVAWVGRHYRERLSAADLADPKLLEESRAALDELTGVLGLGSMYAFQGVAAGSGASQSSAPGVEQIEDFRA